VIVDTGSTDRTKEIAQRNGAKVVDFPWVDSFAAARNEALRHATGTWIFWLDADDRLDEANREKLRQLIASLQAELIGFSMKCRCISDAARDGETVVDHVRLFPNHPGIRWRFRVHEQILGTLRDQGGVVRWVDVVVHHVGYSDPTLRRQKLERDLRLLLLQEQDEPGHAFTLFNLGSIYQELGRHAEALPFLQRSLEKSHPADSIVRKLYALISNSLRQLGQTKDAVETCRTGRRYYPDDEEILFVEGSLCQELGDDAGAEACYQRLLAGRETEHFASVVSGLRGYKTRHNLALLYLKQGRLPEAEAQWRATLAEKPDLVSAWVALGDVYLAGRRWPQVEEVAAWLAARPDGTLPGIHLWARAALARQEFAAAREMLEAMLAQQPAETPLWLLLGEVLLSQGQDLRGAERALLEALRLDPGNAAAQRCLTALWAKTR